MKTLSTHFGKHSVYWGERGHWLVALTQNCTEGLLSESNWFSLLKRLGIDNPNAGQKGSEQLSPTIAIEEASFSGDGWIQYLIVDPDDMVSVKIAEEAEKELEDYPILDETDFSEREDNYYYEAFKDYGRLEIIRALKERVTEEQLEQIKAADIEDLQSWFESCIPSGEYHNEGYPCFDLIGDFSEEEIERLFESLSTSPA